MEVRSFKNSYDHSIQIAPGMYLLVAKGEKNYYLSFLDNAFKFIAWPGGEKFLQQNIQGENGFGIKRIVYLSVSMLGLGFKIGNNNCISQMKKIVDKKYWENGFSLYKITEPLDECGTNFIPPKDNVFSARVE